MAKPEVKAAKVAPQGGLSRGILPSQAIRDLIVGDEVQARRAAAAQPAAAGQPRSAPRQCRLPRARQLPAGPRASGSLRSSTICSCTPSACRRAPCWRPAASTSCRCSKGWRCPTACALRPTRRAPPAGSTCSPASSPTASPPSTRSRPAIKARSMPRSARRRFRSWCARARACRRSASAPAAPMPSRCTTSRCRSISRATRTASSAIAPSGTPASSMSMRSAPAPCSTTGSRSTCAARSG